VVGAESDVMRDDRRNHLNTGGGTRGERVLDQIERVTGLGVFGEVTVPAGERVALLTGLRYDTFRFRAEDRLITATNPDDSGERTMQATSPFAGLVLTLSEAVAVYGNVGTAFQTPTTTELANRPSGAGGFNPELEPQRTTSWEVGLRGRIAGNVAYGLAGYRADVENELIGFQVPATPGRTFFRNAGSTVHRGVEAELAASPIRGLTTRAAYTYTDARFESYATAAQTYDGNRVPGISPHRFDLGTRYQPGPWFGDLQLRSLSPMQVDDANQASSPGYALVDLRAGIDGVRLRGLELSPFLGVNNALDRLYNSSVVVNAAGARYFEPGPGRSVFAGLGVAFGR